MEIGWSLWYSDKQDGGGVGETGKEVGGSREDYLKRRGE